MYYATEPAPDQLPQVLSLIMLVKYTTPGKIHPMSRSGTTATVSGRPADTYTLTVTDDVSSVTCSVTVGQPVAALAVVLDNQTNVLCYGNSTGAINVTASGGTGTISYAWTGPGSFTSINSDLTGLAAGEYNLTVTDASSCTAALATVTITQPAAALAVVLDNQTDVLCYGNSTGAINVTASGGTGTISYAWTGPGSFTSINSDLTGLAAGEYNLTVTDANSCTAVLATVTITQPAAALAVVLDNQTDVLCYGNSTGAINVTAFGRNRNNFLCMDRTRIIYQHQLRPDRTCSRRI